MNSWTGWIRVKRNMAVKGSLTKYAYISEMQTANLKFKKKLNWKNIESICI